MKIPRPIINLLLRFKRTQYEEVTDGFFVYVVRYKMLFRKKYVLGIAGPPPPIHPNCRCIKRVK